MQTTTVADIAAYLSGVGMVRELVGTGSPDGLTVLEGAAAGRSAAPDRLATPISAVATDTDAGPGDLAWSRRAGAAARFGGSLLICGAEGLAEADALPGSGGTVIVCDRPRLAMALVVGRFFAHLSADRPPVYADPATARLVEEMRAWVMNAVVGRDLGIEPLATIGCSGMGYERADDGRLVPFPQLGRVVLEDDVHVAAQAMIQRGAIGDTVVRRGAKIGPHVNVGHNVEVGEDALIAGHAQIGGGARIGSGTVVWQSAAVANGVTIGECAVIGMGAMIRTDVGAGEVWVGNPGRKLR